MKKHATIIPNCSYVVKTNLSIAFFIVLTALCSYGQKDLGYCRGGFSLFIGGAKTSDDLTLLPAITIAPGLRLLKAKEFSLSADLPVSLGISNKNDSYHFGIDAPVILNLNFGLGSSNRSASKFGASLGAGVGYHYSYNEYYDPYYDDDYTQLSVAGYVFQMALFFGGKYKGSGGGIKFSYMTNSNSASIKKNVLGVSIIAIDL